MGQKNAKYTVYLRGTGPDGLETDAANSNYNAKTPEEAIKSAKKLARILNKEGYDLKIHKIKKND